MFSVAVKEIGPVYVVEGVQEPEETAQKRIVCPVAGVAP
jgi:hypothetical protein